MSGGVASKLDLRKAFTSARNGVVFAGSAAYRKAESRLLNEISCVDQTPTV
jgi:hypothetical protein